MFPRTQSVAAAACRTNQHSQLAREWQVAHRESVCVPALTGGLTYRGTAEDDPRSSVVPKGVDWVDLQGVPRRQHCRHSGNGQHEDSRGSEGDGIERTDPK